MLTPEELEGLTPEMREKIQELQQASDKNKTAIERLTLEKEAAENLLAGVDWRRGQPTGTSAIEQNPRDQSGFANMESLVKDASSVEVDSTAFDKETDALTRQILSRFSDEQLREDPAAMRAAIMAIAGQTSKLAFQRAFQHSVNVFQKAVNMKSNIDNVVAQWRLDNPDLAGDKQSEDIVEFFLMKRIMPDPKNQRKDLRTLIDMATDMAREHINSVRERGRDEERRNRSEEVVPLTLRPGNRSITGNGPIRRQPEEERPMTPEESAERFLAMRQKMAAKQAWSGRPS